MIHIGGLEGEELEDEAMLAADKAAKADGVKDPEAVSRRVFLKTITDAKRRRMAEDAKTAQSDYDFGTSPGV